MIRSVTLLVVGLGLSACSDGVSDFPVRPASQADLDEDVTIIRLDESNIDSFDIADTVAQQTTLPGNGGWTYTVGPGDILSILVFNHPELTMPAGPERSAAETGFRVQSDGTFFYPFVGQVKAEGRAPEEIRAELMEDLAEYITDPQIEVRIAAFNSKAASVTGAVATPQRQPLTTIPLRLVDAVNAAGGLTPEADAGRVRVQRNGRTYMVNLESFLEHGARAGNPILRPDDVVFVPKRLPEEVFLFGEVSKPASIDLAGDDLTLTQALAQQGGLDKVRADARGVFVFREDRGGTTVFQLQVSSPEGFLLGTKFKLAPGDVIYVTRSPLQRWNDTISRLLPSVGAVRTIDSTADGL
ncbi:MAG: sugar ABC transporter substrate-binding protein [Verrucomicrobia bacterium]|jgi:polysaccharide export outer membrane protein|nr:sugar ABC transporter substrate-binding protein [Verrucomicrobiota bacterium]